MSGVIDANGVQWERCNCCGEFARLDTLAYMRPRGRFEYGLDLCPPCAKFPRALRSAHEEVLRTVERLLGEHVAEDGALTRESTPAQCRRSRVLELVEDEIHAREVAREMAMV